MAFSCRPLPHPCENPYVCRTLRLASSTGHRPPGCNVCRCHVAGADIGFDVCVGGADIAFDVCAPLATCAVVTRVAQTLVSMSARVAQTLPLMSAPRLQRAPLSRGWRRHWFRCLRHGCSVCRSHEGGADIAFDVCAPPAMFAVVTKQVGHSTRRRCLALP